MQYSVDRGATLDTCLEKIEKSNSLNERSMIFKKRLKKIFKKSELYFEGFK